MVVEAMSTCLAGWICNVSMSQTSVYFDVELKIGDSVRLFPPKHHSSLAKRLQFSAFTSIRL